ncbi:MAG: hypothetical protein J6K32_07785 [Clostridia bacterium]|nr:hypothetical protein [Clostridia bacterium]
MLHSLGASISAVQLRNRDHQWFDAALSPLSFASGGKDPSLAGRTIAPCCGRIRGALIRIGHQPIHLTHNNGAHHIHGGACAAAYQYWTGEQLSSERVRFTLRLPDGLDGYPGNRMLTADYTVSGHTLQVEYSAVSDRPTFMDMTNHVYWDLSGRFDGSAMRQRLEIAADCAVVNDAEHLPMRIVRAERAFDFSRPASPADMLALYPQDEQLLIGRGYNNAFLLSKDRAYAARLSSDETGVLMTMHTDQPAIVFYSGGFLGEETCLAGGCASPGCALALEAQGVPDPFHLPGQTPEWLMPGQTYRRFIRWEFGNI